MRTRAIAVRADAEGGRVAWKEPAAGGHRCGAAGAEIGAGPTEASAWAGLRRAPFAGVATTESPRSGEHMHGTAWLQTWWALPDGMFCTGCGGSRGTPGTMVAAGMPVG